MSVKSDAPPQTAAGRDERLDRAPLSGHASPPSVTTGGEPGLVVGAARRLRARILVVDDEDMVRDVAREYLEHLDYEVETAADGREAVALYARLLEQGGRYDLVILDLVMPGMSGPDCFRLLRGMDPAVKAIASTGYGIDESTRAVLDEGVLACLCKPYRLKQMADTVAGALQAAKCSIP